MRTRLLNLTTVLSLALSMAAAAMWARSLVVTDAWFFTSRPIPKPRRDFHPESRGWQRWRAVASDGGHFVWLSVDERLYAGIPSRKVAGYRRSGSMPVAWDQPLLGDGRVLRVVRVPWLFPAFVGAVLPAVRLWLYRRRPRGPTFEVVTSRSA